MKRSWDHLSTEEKEHLKEDLILFFENERDEKIGVIAAEEIVNFFLVHAGGKIYNQGIRDAQKALDQRMDELRYDLDDLMRD